MLSFYHVIVLVGASLLAGVLATWGTKTQWMRLLDVFVMGPVLIWAGATQLKEQSGWFTQAVLIAMGAATIGYNARNYLTEVKGAVLPPF